MKRKQICFLFGAVVSLMPYFLSAQSVDTLSVRPDHVNNAESPYFPPVFNQDGGSCGSASRIGYMFTHEVNAYRRDTADRPEHIYPTHFTWLLTNSNSGKEGMARANGVPNAAVYGGATYSRLFGNQDCSNTDFGWMQGYDKWYSAMFNRISHNSFSPYGVDTEEGREYVKNWLWNHQGDNSFGVGGICGIGVASACKQGPIADDPQGRNRAAGVVGQKYVTRWGDGVDHALTIVGYDDRIVFDLDSNKVYGERDKDECGAWIIVNSWGNGWANKGFIYCPYKYGFPVRQHEGGAWHPEFYHVRKEYRPMRTLRLLMDYSRRSELKLTVGIASDTAATEPERTVEMEHFKFAGDGRWNRQATLGMDAQTPMLGKWADGKLHDEPMDFGYDLTDLSAEFDTHRPLKYFFIIESKEGAIGTGSVYRCAVVDYEYDRNGVETLLTDGFQTTIRNQGQRTILSAVVWGEPFFAPRNVRIEDGHMLAWDAPQKSHYPLMAYVVRTDKGISDTLGLSTLHYPCGDVTASYSVAALYRTDSRKLYQGAVPYGVKETVSDTVCSAYSATFRPDITGDRPGAALALHRSGFTVPDVFSTNYPEATIEYWLKPDSWRDWNQSAGPGWGRFLIHANDNGSLSAGWDGDSRFDSRPGLIDTDRWHHFAFVVRQDSLTVFVDGEPVGGVRAKNRRGLGGFGHWPFAVNEAGGFDGMLSEVRIWKEARSAEQIRQAMYRRYAGAGIPAGLLAYYKGQLFEQGGKTYWRDFAGGHHAELASFGDFALADEDFPEQATDWKMHDDERLLAIDVPDGMLCAGQVIPVSARCGSFIKDFVWDVPEASVSARTSKNIQLCYVRPGDYEIVLRASTFTGDTLSVRKTLSVVRSVRSADFRASVPVVAAGERISFLPEHPVGGYAYQWTMSGAEFEKAYTQQAATVYPKSGYYKVKLRVKDADGKRVGRSVQRIFVEQVAPEPAFDLSSGVILVGEEVVLTDRSRYVPNKWNWSLDSRKTSLRAQGHKATLRLDAPGVYDVTLEAANEKGARKYMRPRALVVCAADSKNGLNFGNGTASVETKGSWEAAREALTVDWWMDASAQGATSGIGTGKEGWQLWASADGNMRFELDSIAVASGAGFVQPGAWHHYAVQFHKGEVRFYRDGSLVRADSLRMPRTRRVVTTLPQTNRFVLGGEQHPMNAVVDEFRLWNQALPDTLLTRYANAPIAEPQRMKQEHGLMAYYDFNQSGGAVIDRLTGQGLGIRHGFGPDGDAWGASKGVFCLDVACPFTDLSDQVLPQNQRPFASGKASVNIKDAKRFRAFDQEGTVNLKSKEGQTSEYQQAERWIIENAVDNDSIITGMYVDKNKEDALCVYTGWDGFAPVLENHKMYCQIRLPRGKYEFSFVPAQGFAAGASKMAVALGEHMPDFDQPDALLASCPLSDRHLSFVLEKESVVSLGFLFQMSGRSGVAIDRILLHRGSLMDAEK